MIFFSDTRVACVSCMNIIGPEAVRHHGIIGNLKPGSHQEKCRYQIPSDIKHCLTHEIPLLLNKICISCNKDLTIKTINCGFNQIADTPKYDEIIFDQQNGCEVINKIQADENDDIENNQDETLNIIKNIKDNLKGNFRFEINPPSHCIPASAYIQQNNSRIVNAVLESDKINDQNTYHVFLSCYSYYSRKQDGRIHNSYIVHSTDFEVIRPYTERFNEQILNELIKNLQSREANVEKVMQGSGWTYMKTTSLDLTFSRVLGRSVRKKIGNYQEYPKGRRGRDNVINPNPYYFPLWGDVSPGPQNARCVTLAIKAHLMLNSIENKTEKKEALTHMCKKRNGSFDPKYTNAMNQQTVKFPTECENTGNFFASQWRKIQELNKLPICVYALEKSIVNKENVNISCIYAPSQLTLKKYETKPICHLLQSSKTHVMYIPDIQSFFKQILDGEKNMHKCSFCFNGFKSKEGLTTHLQMGLCIRQRSQPPKTTLVKNAVIKHLMLKDTTTPEMQILMDMECIVKNLKANTVNQDNEDLSSSDPNEQMGGPKKDHIPFSIGTLPIDDKYQSLGYESISGESVGEKMLDKIEEIIERHREKIREKRFLKPILTLKDQIHFNNQTNCMFCQVSFASLGHSKFKHRHHNHKVAPVYETRLKRDGSRYENLVKGNYSGAACHRCNWQVTNLRNSVVCLFHNGSAYDYPILMKGMVKAKSRVKHIKISPKGANSYYQIRYKDVKLIDSLSFLSTSLSSLVENRCKDMDPNNPELTLPLTIKSLKESRFNDEVIPYLFRKLVFPYNLPQSVEDFYKIKSFPKKEDFYDELAESHVSEEDYQYAKDVWEKAGCKNLKDLHDLYLLCDTCMLADVWVSFSNMVFNDFGLVCSNMMTGPSLIYRAALKMGETDIELIDDMSMYETFEGMLRGGYCCATQRRVICNNIDLDSYDKNKDDVKFKLIDFNSLYAGCLRENVPVGNFRYLTKEEVAKFECKVNGEKNIMNINSSKFSKKGYVFTVDIELPNDLKTLVDDFPLGMVNTFSIDPSEHTKSINEKGGQEKLIAGHFDLCKYSFDIRLLKFYLSVGCKITKIHDVLSFNQKPVFKKYIDHCIQKRKEAIRNNNSVGKQHYKLMCNSLYGRTILNDRNFATNTHLVSIGDDLAKAQGKQHFKSVRFISKDIAAVTTNKKEIKLNSPIFIGATVLQLAKLKNYEFHYKVAKPSCASFPKDRIPVDPKDKEIIEKSREYIQDVTLVYCDTDSLGYKFTMTEKGKGTDHEFLYKETFLRHYLDRSNFQVLSKDGPNEAGGLGFLKSEVADDIIKEIICLSPKCYSIETKQRVEKHTNIKPQTKYKQAIKGCPSKVAAKIYPHSVFQNILNQTGYKVPEASTNHIRRHKQSGVQTVRLTRTSLSLYDNKRWWVDDFTSYAYGHENTGYVPGCILTVKGGYIKDTENMLIQTTGIDDTESYEYGDNENDEPETLRNIDETPNEINNTTEPNGNIDDLTNWGCHDDGDEEENNLVYNYPKSSGTSFRNELCLKRKCEEDESSTDKSIKKSKCDQPFQLDFDEMDEDFFSGHPHDQTDTDLDMMETADLTPPTTCKLYEFIF